MQNVISSFYDTCFITDNRLPYLIMQPKKVKLTMKHRPISISIQKYKNYFTI